MKKKPRRILRGFFSIRASVLIEPRLLPSFVLTRFRNANRRPPPDQVRGHASLENALVNRAAGLRRTGAADHRSWSHHRRLDLYFRLCVLALVLAPSFLGQFRLAAHRDVFVAIG